MAVQTISGQSQAPEDLIIAAPLRPGGMNLPVTLVWCRRRFSSGRSRPAGEFKPGDESEVTRSFNVRKRDSIRSAIPILRPCLA